MKHAKTTTPIKPRPWVNNAPVALPGQANYSKLVDEEFLRFREIHPARRLSKNLRTMLLDFMMFDGAIEARYLQDLLFDLQGLFSLLEAIQLENEWKDTRDD